MTRPPYYSKRWFCWVAFNSALGSAGDNGGSITQEQTSAVWSGARNEAQYSEECWRDTGADEKLQNRTRAFSWMAQDKLVTLKNFRESGAEGKEEVYATGGDDLSASEQLRDILQSSDAGECLGATQTFNLQLPKLVLVGVVFPCTAQKSFS
ncbi:hypothetical protein Nepgr_004765 [Nepenthes gracilis]|uniref:Uncharacterized protein n=1 Tax=Nepenthes gracilis TaxID=150966 RepID=A0AAD3XFR8_NEPGR|nr:hypothetical protein Nepgr_004765 [Nepenthes gracilis]